MQDNRRDRGRRVNFTLGGEQAESDPLLQEAFYDSDDYITIESKEDKRCFLIARTGGGKSALLRRLEEEHPEHVIHLTPEDLSLPYITDLDVMHYLTELEVHLDPLFIALWKHVLLVELIRHRYKVDSSEAKANFLTTLREKIRKDPAKRAALDYLDDFEGRFWAESDERVREITDRFEKRIDAEAKARSSLGWIGEANLGRTKADTQSKEVRTELAGRFQRIVNETQLARLNKMLVVLNDDILDSPQNFTYVVIDDLDRDWVDENLVNALIRCLFRTVVDLQRVRNLKVVVALRTNIFIHLDFGMRSGGQEEKFRALTLQMRWTKSELREMINERVRVSTARNGNAISSVGELLPTTNRRRGDPLEYMLDRTLMRPRDAIAFVNESLRVAGGKDRVSWEDIHHAERSYSLQRLLALRDEWKTSYPDIDKAFEIFVGCTAPLTREEFSPRLNEIALLAARQDFRGNNWLADMTNSMWHSTGDERWSHWYQPLTKLLFDIGFIGIASGPRSHFHFSLSSPGFADRASNLDSAAFFDVHVTFQAGLDLRRAHGFR